MTSPAYKITSVLVVFVMAAGQPLRLAPAWAESTVSLEEATTRLTPHLEYLEQRMMDEPMATWCPFCGRASAVIRQAMEGQVQEFGNAFQEDLREHAEGFRRRLQLVEDALAKHGVSAERARTMRVTPGVTTISLGEDVSRQVQQAWEGLCNFYGGSWDALLQVRSSWRDPAYVVGIKLSGLDAVERQMQTLKQLEQQTKELLAEYLDLHAKLAGNSAQRQEWLALVDEGKAPVDRAKTFSDEAEHLQQAIDTVSQKMDDVLGQPVFGNPYEELYEYGDTREAHPGEPGAVAWVPAQEIDERLSEDLAFVKSRMDALTTRYGGPAEGTSANESEAAPAEGCAGSTAWAWGELHRDLYDAHLRILEGSRYSVGYYGGAKASDVAVSTRGMAVWKRIDQDTPLLVEAYQKWCEEEHKIHAELQALESEQSKRMNQLDQQSWSGSLSREEYREQYWALSQQYWEPQRLLRLQWDEVSERSRTTSAWLDLFVTRPVFTVIRGIPKPEGAVVETPTPEEPEQDFEVTFFDEEPPEPVIVDIIVLDDAPMLKGKPIPWLPGFTKDEQIRTTRLLFVYGWDLPTDTETSVTLSSPDPKITYTLLEYASPHNRNRWSSAEGRLNAWELGWELALDGVPKERAKTMKLMSAMLVEAKLQPGLLPDFKDLTLGDETGQWLLRYGNTRASLQVVRALGEEQTEPTPSLFLPEQAVFIELNAEHEVELEEVELALGQNGQVLKTGTEGQPLLLKAARVPDNPKTYRTPPIAIVEDRPSPPPVPPGGVQLFLKPKDTLFAVPIQSELFLMAPAVAQAQVYRTPGELKSLWREALFRAVKARKGEDWWDEYWNKVLKIQSLSEEEVYKISHLIITEARIRTTRVTVGQLAAAIIVRDALIELLAAHQKELPSITTDEQFWALRALIALHIQKPSFPLRDVPVRAAELDLASTFMTEPLWKSFDEAYLAKLKPEYRRNYQLQAMKDAFTTYTKAVDYALQKARNTDERDINALLELTSAGMEPVVAMVRPRLVMLDESQRPHLRWVPDKIARAEVNGIPTLGAELRAAKELAEADTQVALAVGSLIPFIGPAGSLGRILMSAAVGAAGLAEAVYQIPEYYNKQAELQFASGVAGILGPDRMHVAQLKETSWWGTIAAVAVGGLGMGFDLVDAMRTASKAAALARQAELLKRLEGGGMEAYLAMSKADKMALNIIIGEAELLKEAGKISAAQRRMLEAAHELQTELQNLKRAITETDALDPLASGAASRAADGAKALGPPPNPGSVFTTPDGETFSLGNRLGGENKFALVYDLLNNPDYPKHVVKFMTPQTARRVQQCSKLLEQYDIPQLKNVEYRIGDKMAVVIQEKGVRGTDFKMFDYDDALDPAIFKPDFQEATVKLYRKLADAGIAFEDGHVENLYYVKRHGEWIAGILDQDHLALWENMPHELVRRIDGIEMLPWRYGIHSVPRTVLDNAAYAPHKHKRFFSTPEFFMEKMLEHKGWIQYGEGGFVRRRVDMDLARKYFPNIDKDVVTDWGVFLGAGR